MALWDHAVTRADEVLEVTNQRIRKSFMNLFLPNPLVSDLDDM
jgi:hypothetical protein